VPSSFAHDEPVSEILDAASVLQDAVFYMTGDISRVNRSLLEQKSQNVVFTGFLDKDDYVRLLDDSDAVMALTTRDGTLLAGAYEAVALEKPLITSNRGPLVRYFDKGAIHVDNSAKEIISAVKAVPQKKRQMNREMHLLKEEKIRDWESAFAKFKSIIGQPADAAVA
jgi:glycosyltransferase involved in cell wall biosynthesis